MDLEADSLTRLVTPLDYQVARSNLFPSEASLRWQLRAHRARLEASGAVLRIAGRLLVDPVRFDQALIDIARGGARSA